MEYDFWEVYGDRGCIGADRLGANRAHTSRVESGLKYVRCNVYSYRGGFSCSTRISCMSARHPRISSRTSWLVASGIGSLWVELVILLNCLPMSVAQFRFSEAPTYSQSYVLPVIRSLILPSDQTVMDFGCGNGYSVKHLLSDRRAFGIDGSVSGIETARSLAPSADFRLADLTSDLANHPAWGSCDLVISTEVIEHIYDPRAFTRNCYGFLKYGGRAIISTPYHGYLKNLALSVRGKWDHHFTALQECGHIKFWSRATLSRLFSEAGFWPAAFHGCGRLPYVWKSMVMVFRK